MEYLPIVQLDILITTQDQVLLEKMTMKKYQNELMKYKVFFTSRKTVKIVSYSVKHRIESYRRNSINTAIVI